ncbi:hypothetical protein [Embleya sp. NPDC001921]
MQERIGLEQLGRQGPPLRVDALGVDIVDDTRVQRVQGSGEVLQVSVRRSGTMSMSIASRSGTA